MLARWGFLLIISANAAAQSPDAAALFEKAKSFGDSITTWRAEVLRVSQMSYKGTTTTQEGHTSVSVQAPFRMKRENSGDDRTIMVCDGTNSYYSGDRLSYYRTPEKECVVPLFSFYEGINLVPSSLVMVGHDHVALKEGVHPCDEIRSDLKREAKNGIPAIHVVTTLCIDPVSGLILRLQSDGETNGMRIVTTTTFVSFEVNPSFPPDTFKFTIPPGAVEAHPP